MSDPSWQAPAPPDRIVAVGDIHGDLDALLGSTKARSTLRIEAGGPATAPKKILAELLPRLNNRLTGTISCTELVRNISSAASSSSSVYLPSSTGIPAFCASCITHSLVIPARMPRSTLGVRQMPPLMKNRLLTTPSAT